MCRKIHVRAQQQIATSRHQHPALNSRHLQQLCKIAPPSPPLPSQLHATAVVEGRVTTAVQQYWLSCHALIQLLYRRNALRSHPAKSLLLVELVRSVVVIQNQSVLNPLSYNNGLNVSRAMPATLLAALQCTQQYFVSYQAFPCMP